MEPQITIHKVRSVGPLAAASRSSELLLLIRWTLRIRKWWTCCCKSNALCLNYVCFEGSMVQLHIHNSDMYGSLHYAQIMVWYVLCKEHNVELDMYARKLISIGLCIESVSRGLSLLKQINCGIESIKLNSLCTALIMPLIHKTMIWRDGSSKIELHCRRRILVKFPMLMSFCVVNRPGENQLVLQLYLQEGNRVS